MSSNRRREDEEDPVSDNSGPKRRSSSMPRPESRRRSSAPKNLKDYTHNSKGVETGFSADQKKELFNPFVDDEEGESDSSADTVKYASGDNVELNSYDGNPFLASEEDIEEEAAAQREYAVAQRKQAAMPTIKPAKKQSSRQRSAPNIPNKRAESLGEAEFSDPYSTEETLEDETASASSDEGFGSFFGEDEEDDKGGYFDDDYDDDKESSDNDNPSKETDNNASNESIDDDDPFSEVSDEDLFGDIDDAIEEGNVSLEDTASADDWGDSFDNPFADDDDSGSAFDSEFEADEDDEIQFGQSVFDGFDVNAILADAIDQGASDVHISANKGVRFTVLGEIRRCPEYPIPDGRITKAVQEYMTTNMADQDFIREKELDTAYVIKDDPMKRSAGIDQRHIGRRLRVSIGLEFDDVFIVMRIINEIIPTPEELGVPDSLIKWLDAPAGLVLVNGSTGTGKTTTLASILRKKQLTSPEKIVTIEKPVEFVYPDDGKALVNQREVGRDTDSFDKALTSAMRQAPDTILIGEVRNKEEIDALLVAADTGHLAISTMHTNSVSITLNRIKSMFEGEEQNHVLHQLSDALQGIVNQVLLKTVDGKGRFAVREMLPMNAEIRPLVAAGDVESVRAYQREHKITMEHHLADAVYKGKCTFEVGRYEAVNSYEFDEYLEDLLNESEGDVVREADLM